MKQTNEEKIKIQLDSQSYRNQYKLKLWKRYPQIKNNNYYYFYHLL